MVGDNLKAVNFEDELLGVGEQVESIDKIEFKNVKFKYSSNTEWVLDDFCFSFRNPQQILIKGKIGSGKSTIAKLILGLYKPQHGTIEINQTNIDLIDKSSLRSHIGIVSQNVFLFRGTVFDNISCGNMNILKPDVMAMLHK